MAVKYQTMNINGSVLHFADYPGEKGTILAVHGLTGNHLQMHYYAELLKGEYRFISVDLKGRGNSGPASENTGIELHTQDILALIDTLNINQPILMGYSMGAFIMANVASKRSDVKGVILLDGAATCTDHQRQIVEPSLGRISKQYETAESYIQEIKGIYGRLGVEWTEHLANVGNYEIAKKGEHWENKSNEEEIRQDFQSFYDYKPEKIFKNVECPILLIHSTGEIGAMPALFLAESYAETLKNAKNIWKYTSNSNHYTLVFEERKDVNPVIQRFLERL
ncbi:alpha/beta hydrolase [Lysinibacillus xylanilyticus]|uniref:alpha/beta fold hydrolase n=1 Tax=Lysinibacillus xylanilyticus TaxID=582475 RepID=UPI002B252777|nr:alpha/beta hydrolase [Lysinibacillus xylanilyticus]MEB2279563.1 alpha/beta hydrolase [Lysinibacillus xylanilyticus]